MARILITGSTDGFGLEAARQLVQRNHTVYLHARNQQRAEDAKALCPGAAGVLVGDVTNVAETRKLAEEANAIGTFDVVILNAGLFHGPIRKTPDTGVPAMVFVNVLAPYILTCLLNKPKRLVFISSILHFQAKADLKDMWWFERGEAEWDEFQAYCDSKLQVMLFANAVARRFKGTSVTTVHPGYVPTKLAGNEATDKMEDGIETYLMLAEGDYDQSLTGVYFVPNKKHGEHLPAASDQDLQERVVKACEDFTGLKLDA
ncbi:Short-chain dehydrogenase chyC [Cladobotryum mycophilum]|uniref:Short-chain dehydrogenase chyC n=1 Tax=Cladobotryum mycophilum TaxID=491253 RepID=A0ABR0SR23_9HYPO